MDPGDISLRDACTRGAEKLIADKWQRCRYDYLLEREHSPPHIRLYSILDTLLFLHCSCCLSLVVTCTCIVCACWSSTSRIAGLPYLNSPIAEASPRPSQNSHGRRPRTSRHLSLRPSLRNPPSRFHTLFRRQCNDFEH